MTSSAALKLKAQARLRLQQQAATPQPRDPALFVPGDPPAPAPTEPEKPWYEQLLTGVGETVDYTVDRARIGAGNIAGLPVDLVNASPLIMRLFGVDAQPFNLPGGSDGINQATKQLTMRPDYLDEMEPNWIQTVLGRIGEEVGATAVPGLGIIKAAETITRPVMRESKNWFVKHVLEPAAVNPAKFAQKEVAAATAAGTGAGIANTMVDRDTTGGQFADLLGAIGGVTIAGIGGAVGKSLGDVLAAATGNRKYASDVVRQNVADTLISNSDVLGRQVNPNDLNAPIDTDTILDLLSSPAMAEEVIPGFRASTADRAGDAGLASLENARARGPTNAAFRTRQMDNTTAIDEAVNTAAPTTPTAGPFFDALETQRGAQVSRAENDNAAAIEAAQRALDPLAVSSTPTTRGNSIRVALEDARGAARANTDAMYDAADTSGNMVNPTELARVIDESTSGLTAAERSLIPEPMLDRVRALGVGSVDEAGQEIAPDPVDLREATTLLSEIKRLQRAALADPRAEKGGRNAARVLDQISTALDDFITGNVTPEQRTALDAARAAKFDEAERFTRQGDPVAAALERYEGGQPKMADERVAGSFTTPDRNLERLFTEANTPATRTSIREEMLSRLDNSTPESIARFMSTFEPQIARFPGLADELRGAAGARATEADTGAQLDQIIKRLGSPDGTVPGSSTVAKFLRNDATQARKAMEGVLSTGKPGPAMDELLRFVGDEPQAVEGARRAFWDVMESKARSSNAAFETADGIEPWMPKKWRDFLDEPNVAAVAERLYQDNPEHLAKIREIAEALRGVNTASKSGMATNPSGTAASMRGGAVTLAEAQAKFIDVQRGRLNPLYAVTYLAGKLAHRAVSKQAEKAFASLLDQALLNPKVAEELMRDNNPANRAALARSAKGWLGNQASTLVDLLNDENDVEPEDDVVKIVVRGGNKEAE